jgi:hypothetical protein
MRIISKKEAIERGQIYYYTGKPCKHGHDSVRMVKGGACNQCSVIRGEINRNKDREKFNEACRRSKKKHYTTEKRRERYQSNIVSELYYHAKNRAKLKNIPFTIDEKDVIIPETCPILGIPLSFEDKEMSPTLDRKINELGYVKNNVYVISKRANRLKSDATIHELEKIIHYMKNNIEVKNA